MVGAFGFREPVPSIFSNVPIGGDTFPARASVFWTVASNYLESLSRAGKNIGDRRTTGRLASCRALNAENDPWFPTSSGNQFSHAELMPIANKMEEHDDFEIYSYSTVIHRLDV
jgi:hypothetical protein